jgi:hypothetical protein
MRWLMLRKLTLSLVGELCYWVSWMPMLGVRNRMPLEQQQSDRVVAQPSLSS